jgi:hypothetical protein
MYNLLALATLVVVLVIPALIVCAIVGAPQKKKGEEANS